MESIFKTVKGENCWIKLVESEVRHVLCEAWKSLS